MFGRRRWSDEKLFQFIAKGFLLLLRRARYCDAHRQRHRDHDYETQFCFHTNANRLSGQFLEHSLIHSNPRFEIFQRKIFIGRMRAAILQCQTN